MMEHHAREERVIVRGTVPPREQDTIKLVPLSDPYEEATSVVVDTVEELGTTAARFSGTYIRCNDLCHVVVIADNTDADSHMSQGMATFWW